MSQETELIIQKIFSNYHIKCDWCEEELESEEIDLYDHPNGFEMKGYEKKQWISFKCPKCGYYWALGKLIYMIKRGKFTRRD